MKKEKFDYAYNEKEYGWIVSVDDGKEEFYPTKIEVIDNCVYDILDGCSYVEITAPSDKVYSLDIESERNKRYWKNYTGKSIRARLSDLLCNEEN